MKAIIEKKVITPTLKSGFVSDRPDEEIVIIKFFSIPIYRKERLAGKKL